jgi:hypothetical protein
MKLKQLVEALDGNVVPQDVLRDKVEIELRAYCHEGMNTHYNNRADPPQWEACI